MGTQEMAKDTLENMMLRTYAEQGNDKVFKQCIHTYGADPQIDMMIEEMSELTKALLKWRRSRKNVTNLKKTTEDIIDELADVKIMVRQMELLFGCEKEVEERIDFKVEWQKKRLENRGD